MSLYKQFKTDANLERDGILIDYGPNSKDLPTRFRLARAGGQNKAYAKALEKATRPHKKSIQMGSLDNNIADRIFMEVFVDTVVLGWENVEDENGNDLEFTRENVLKLFTDLPDLYQDLREQAQNASLFREELLEEDLGNSGGSSSTASSKARSKEK